MCSSDLRFESSSTALSAYQTFYNNGANQTYFGIENSSGTGIIGSGSAYATILSTVSTAPLVFGTNSAERLRIGTSGQIGIGGANYGTSGQVLTSNGSGSEPSWQTSSGITTGKSIAMAMIFGF